MRDVRGFDFGTNDYRTCARLVSANGIPRDELYTFKNGEVTQAQLDALGKPSRLVVERFYLDREGNEVAPVRNLIGRIVLRPWMRKLTIQVPQRA
jgi:hypothetical protein